MGIFSKNNRNLKTDDGFTLMELIIAMTIIAILAGAIIGNFFTSISKGRDARRKQDLESISKALELYYNDNKAYPAGSLGSVLKNADGNVIYMQRVPTDPKEGYLYTYNMTAGGKSYKLYSCLENTNDASYHDYGAGVTCGSSCGNCKYGISSANTTP